MQENRKHLHARGNESTSAATSVAKSRALPLADHRPSVQAKMMQGSLLANEGPIVQRKSRVINQGQIYSTGKRHTLVGHSMKAWLEPGSLLQGESANINTDQDGMMEDIRAAYGIVGGGVVKGHLLNDNLGGKALNNNLFPITRAANKQHLVTTENYAKQALWTHKNSIWYTVDVAGAANIANPVNGFVVHIGLWNGGTDYSSKAMHPAAVSGTITSDLRSVGDNDLANSDDMEKHSAATLNTAIAGGLALHPHTKVGDMSQTEKTNRENSGSIVSSQFDA